MEKIQEFINKTLICSKCNRKLDFKIDKKQIEELRDSQLFNFVIMHANDHTLVISVDGRGEIRRSRIATLNAIEEEKKSSDAFQDIQIIEESNNLREAFVNWFEKRK
ncbi:MAG: hypothetical protein K9W46_09850 [Candidatus Heimdallarchaeum endolithica]|uniref:Uncharacterized protein n=1 Tax=Candidatus Heimdallarchaeum endolithica TaxID=2876572 RepID=A0A9Y1BPA3_9ARCH|nr:MAG: hypothetical protein K9W46_09850 [Candidatus Heimdallarchaeum endolithica]